MGAKATFYTDTKLIEFDIVAPVSSRVAIDTQIDLYSDAKEDWQTEAYQRFEFPFTTIGGNDLGGGLEAGDYYFLRTDLGWRIRPYEGDHYLTITGNLYPIDANDDLLVPTSTAATVAVVLERSQLTQTVQDQIAQTASAVWSQPASAVASGSMGEVMRSLSFGEKVYFDGDLGTAGTSYPLGQQRYPVNTFDDAITISQRESAPIIHMESEGVILATDDVSGCIIEGHHPLKVQCQVSTGATTVNTQFRELYLRNAVLDGNVVVREAVMENVSGFQGFAFQAMLNPGTITLTGASPTHFLSCFSGRPGTSTPILDINNANKDVGIRDYWGGIQLENNNKSNNISIDLGSGQIILASTVVSGTVVARGVGKLIDTSGNTIDTGTWNGGVTIVNETTQNQGGALTAAQDARLRELHQIFGLESGTPMKTTASTRSAGTISQTITGDAETSVTVSRI
jgi:hypothetical protein